MIYNQTLALQRAGNHPAIAKQMLQQLIETLPQQQQQIKSNYQQQNWQALWDQVHYLHSATVYCATEDLQQICAELEQAITDKQLTKITETMPYLDQAISNLLAWFKKAR